jgi:hypothetical protein
MKPSARCPQLTGYGSFWNPMESNHFHVETKNFLALALALAQETFPALTRQ